MKFFKIMITSLLFFIGGLILLYKSNRERSDYINTTGTITYFSKEYKEFPKRFRGSYRYLKIDSYPYVFEIYEPNSVRNLQTIDDLRVGDNIEIYYSENSDTQVTGINDNVEFIDYQSIPFFINIRFEDMFSYIFIGFGVMIAILGLNIKVNKYLISKGYR
ncbi:hypothetical protein [Sphingobacterium prati]|uniref:hypothetical protein n=1 Tax=Sphingobacterium prati TaxID=2737006 RepID=UPI001555B88B|nr:hypothetical protein [Sphingobacterium prati]NPE46271.1 hypothetical protein [Sphingobacterium prati]